MATILWQHILLTTDFTVVVCIHLNIVGFPVHLKCPVAVFIQLLFRGCPRYVISMDSIVCRVSFNSVAVIFLCSGVE